MEWEGHKSGFVSIIGKPNAGKSTLLNKMLGRKLCITTHKAQTTRHRIIGIDNGDNHQIVYSDTPGIIRPKYGLQKAMMSSVKHSLEDADLILLLIDVNEQFSEEELFDLVGKHANIPIILVLNKVDKAEDKKVFQRKDEVEARIKPVASIGISALHEINLFELKKLILDHLSDGPAYYDKDMISDRPERFFITEIIREKIFLNLKEEIPYSCEVGVIDYEEGEKLDKIFAEIHVERKSQKGMLIGKGGKMIKKIGEEARRDIEIFQDKHVYLELHVRVAEGWKNDQMKLKGFGYKQK